jgi:uncharacterized membrane protein
MYFHTRKSKSPVEFKQDKGEHGITVFLIILLTIIVTLGIAIALYSLYKLKKSTSQNEGEPDMDGDEQKCNNKYYNIIACAIGIVLTILFLIGVTTGRGYQKYYEKNYDITTKGKIKKFHDLSEGLTFTSVGLLFVPALVGLTYIFKDQCQ